MAQMNWIYLDDRGGRHSIGLYHGDRSGHMLIHCNRKIIQIDFSVKETKTYSFFVEDEFCEMIVDCCMKERTYLKFYGLLAERFCNIDDAFKQNNISIPFPQRDIHVIKPDEPGL